MIAVGIAIATIASFLVSAVLYAAPPVSRLIERTSTPRPGIPVPMQMASVVVRGFVAACLIAGLMTVADWHGPLAGAYLGLALSVLPLTLLSGGVVHENTAIPTAGVHLLDWIVKLTLTGALIGLFA